MATIKQRYEPNIKNIKYLKYPIKSEYRITEGFLYSKQELSIRGYYFHKGIDYACKWGTPIYASASGYLVASYHRYPTLNKDKTLMLYKGLPQGNGLGYFIQIFHPEKVCGIKGGRITQYGHLSKFAPGIYARTFKPIIVNYEKEILRRYKKSHKKISEKDLQEKISETLVLVKQYPWITKLYGYAFNENLEKKEAYLYNEEELKYLKGSKYVQWVEQGELIGYTGSSSIIWGDLTYKENCERPNVKEFATWDEVHLHFEEAGRNSQTRAKELQRDPYGIYLSKEHYKSNKEYKDNIFVEGFQKSLW